jgi:hypothetical protein
MERIFSNVEKWGNKIRRKRNGKSDNCGTSVGSTQAYQDEKKRHSHQSFQATT